MRTSYFLILAFLLNIFPFCQQKKGETSDNIIIVDIGDISTPISPFIYGQFIEHLGRCIYGGIWAEMLEDRKFFYPITSEYNPWGTRSDPFWKAGEFKILVGSPWKVIGDPQAVSMTTRKPFVGEQDPEITLAGKEEEAGIGQEGLLLEMNREYTGRIYLAASSPDIIVKVSVKSEKNEPAPIAEYTGLEDAYGRTSATPDGTKGA